MINLRDVRAIYFDLDDTLCAYWDASKIGLRATFAAHRPAGLAADEWIRHWAASFREFAPSLKETGWYRGYLQTGEPTRTEQMRLTLLRAGIDDPELASLLSQAYMEERDRALTLFTDAIRVLDELGQHYTLGLITNGPADIQRQEIATLGIERYFKHIFIEGEIGEGKPSKSVFDLAATAVGCQPREILMVGNSYGHDVRSALECGWHAIWVKRSSDVPPSAVNREHKAEEIPDGAPRPDAVIGSLDKLLALLSP